MAFARRAPRQRRACLVAAVAAASPARGELLRGVAYGAALGEGHAGDAMSAAAVPLWGRTGRGDLRIMRQLGANAVSLRGMDDEVDRTNFLDSARQIGVDVALDLNLCDLGSSDCFSTASERYEKMLRRGGMLTPTQGYHPALRFLSLLGPPRTSNMTGDLSAFALSAAQAFDAILATEARLGVTGPSVNVTVSVPFLACPRCPELGETPALGFMALVEAAIKEPRRFGYSPHTEIDNAYGTRFTHSFTVQATAAEIRERLLQPFSKRFPTTPVYVAEYTAPEAGAAELALVLDAARASPFFRGAFFYQYFAPDAVSPERNSTAVFGPGGRAIGSVNISGPLLDVPCLAAARDTSTGEPITTVISGAYRGYDLDLQALCGMNPWAVPLTQAGYAVVSEEGNFEHMKVFVRQVVEHLGASVSPDGGANLVYFTKKYASKGGNFFRLVSELRASPDWVMEDPNAACVADRNAKPELVSQAIQWMCKHANSFSCDDVPEECSWSAHRMGDFVFSRYYRELRGYVNPLVSCYAEGAAVFATSGRFLRNSWSRACVAGASELAEPTGPPKDPHDFLEGIRGDAAGGRGAAGDGLDDDSPPAQDMPESTAAPPEEGAADAAGAGTASMGDRDVAGPNEFLALSGASSCRGGAVVAAASVVRWLATLDRHTVSGVMAIALPLALLARSA